MQQHFKLADTRHAYRHVYRPGPDRMPRWVWRLWAWF
jgi:hypothetical protein